MNWQRLGVGLLRFWLLALPGGESLLADARPVHVRRQSLLDRSGQKKWGDFIGIIQQMVYLFRRQKPSQGLVSLQVYVVKGSWTDQVDKRWANA